MNDRLEKLQAMLQRQPDDAFLLYGIAMEMKKSGSYEEALNYLTKVIAVDPGYCYAYFQQGQVNEAKGDMESAKRAYRAGLIAAEKKGDAHAKDEIAGALSMIE
jgi:tetratricopeptide (TPR) repeat protein